MKMSESLFDELSAKMLAKTKPEEIKKHAEYLKKNNSKYQPGGRGNLPMRVRWDWFNHTKLIFPELMSNKELNDLYDSHIETALKKICENSGLLEFAK